MQAASTDFEPSYAAGFKDRERQESRARDAAWNQAIHAHASQALANALTDNGTFGMDLSRTVQNLLSRGWHVEVRDIEAPGEDSSVRDAATVMLNALRHARLEHLPEPVPLVDEAIAHGERVLRGDL